MSSSKRFGNPSSVSDMNVNSAQGGEWEEYGKKSKNRNRNIINASKPWASQHSSSKVWGHSDTLQKLGLRTNGGYGRGSAEAGPALSSDSTKNAGPRKNGWGGATGAASSRSSDDGVLHEENAQAVQLADNQASEVDEESDGIEDSDDEFLSDGFDSDESHETWKKNRWFREFFQCLDRLTVEEINKPERRWHCPACKGGPGAIDWYHGLQPLITHARTIRSKRVKLHRKLAELLDEELRRRGCRGMPAVPAGEIYGKWKGLEERADKEIVWPPMVVIMNTRLERDENDNWIGMGNQELLEYFSAYSVVKARHSYGPQGHRGMSVLIFEPSAVGYAEAERLSKHFEDNNKDRIAWEKNRVPFSSGGKRQLYGYVALKQDLENFNQHSLGRSKLKYEMRSYQEMVVNQMRQMSEDNQQLVWFKNKVAKEQMSKKALEEHFLVMTKKLQKTVVENRIMKLRTKTHHEQNKEEMDSQEQFYREHIQQLSDARNAKEENFEKTQQYERDKITRFEEYVSSVEQQLRRGEEIAKSIQLQDKKMEEFVEEWGKLMKEYAEQMLDLMRRHWEEELALEKKYDEGLNKLMDNYTPAESKHGDSRTRK